MEVLKLLESKIRCLRKFLHYSEDFLSHTASGTLSDLSGFQKKREAAIKALLLYDRKIASVIAGLQPEQKTQSLVTAVRKALSLKEKLIETILVTDQKIIVKIEEEKNRLLAEMSASDRNRQIFVKFKSKWIPESGEKLDGSL